VVVDIGSSALEGGEDGRSNRPDVRAAAFNAALLEVLLILAALGCTGRALAEVGEAVAAQQFSERALFVAGAASREVGALRRADAADGAGGPRQALLQLFKELLFVLGLT